MLGCDAQHRFDSRGVSVELLDVGSTGMRNFTQARQRKSALSAPQVAKKAPIHLEPGLRMA